jgi:hypothetical protein
MKSALLVVCLVACSSETPAPPVAAAPAPAPASRPAPPPVPATEPTTLTGKDFTIPVPPGFKVSPVALGPDSLALLQKKRLPDPDAFLASIVVSPVPEDSSDCNTIARKTAGLSKLTVKGPPPGPAAECRFEAIDPTNPRRAAQFTLRKKGASLWMVTCNHDPADTAALAACQAILDGWTWTS